MLWANKKKAVDMETLELAGNYVVQCQAWRGAASLPALKVKEEEEEEGQEEQEEQEVTASVNMRCLLACIANISAIETEKKVCLGKKKVWINNRVFKFQMTLEHKALNTPCSGGLRVLPVKVHQHFRQSVFLLPQYPSLPTPTPVCSLLAGCEVENWSLVPVTFRCLTWLLIVCTSQSFSWQTCRVGAGFRAVTSVFQINNYKKKKKKKIGNSIYFPEVPEECSGKNSFNLCRFSVKMTQMVIVPLRWWPLTWSVVQLETLVMTNGECIRCEMAAQQWPDCVRQEVGRRANTMGTPSSPQKYVSLWHVAFPLTYINRRGEGEFGRCSAVLSTMTNIVQWQRFEAQQQITFSPECNTVCSNCI